MFESQVDAVVIAVTAGAILTPTALCCCRVLRLKRFLIRPGLGSSGLGLGGLGLGLVELVEARFKRAGARSRVHCRLECGCFRPTPLVLLACVEDKPTTTRKYNRSRTDANPRDHGPGITVHGTTDRGTTVHGPTGYGITDYGITDYGI